MSDQIKTVGDIVKYDIIKPEPELEIQEFFDRASSEAWLIEDVLLEWDQNDTFKSIILPIGPHRTQFATMENDIPYIYGLMLGNTNYELIFLEEVDRIKTDEIKNADELSGIGRILVPFNLKFENFPLKYTKANNTEFFKLNNSQILLNGIRLVLDKIDGIGGHDSGIKLTGKAAEIAERRAKNGN